MRRRIHSAVFWKRCRAVASFITDRCASCCRHEGKGTTALAALPAQPSMLCSDLTLALTLTECNAVDDRCASGHRCSLLAVGRRRCSNFQRYRRAQLRPQFGGLPALAPVIIHNPLTVWSGHSLTTVCSAWKLTSTLGWRMAKASPAYSLL